MSELNSYILVTSKVLYLYIDHSLTLLQASASGS